MVGLSVVLEGYKGNAAAGKSSFGSQVVSKASMIIKPLSPSSCSPSPASPSGKSPFSRRSAPAPAAGFLDCCFLCKQKLLPGKDIYMYKGDRGFCSVECRCRQIVMDEEDQTAMKSSTKRDQCSSAQRGATGNRPNAFIAY